MHKDTPSTQRTISFTKGFDIVVMVLSNDQYREEYLSFALKELDGSKQS